MCRTTIVVIKVQSITVLLGDIYVRCWGRVVQARTVTSTAIVTIMSRVVNTGGAGRRDYLLSLRLSMSAGDVSGGIVREMEESPLIEISARMYTSKIVWKQMGV